mgnify:CR=1 FL=1
MNPHISNKNRFSTIISHFLVNKTLIFPMVNGKASLMKQLFEYHENKFTSNNHQSSKFSAQEALLNSIKNCKCQSYFLPD